MFWIVRYSKELSTVGAEYGHKYTIPSDFLPQRILASVENVYGAVAALNCLSEQIGHVSQLVQSQDHTGLDPIFMNSGVVELAHFFLIFEEYKRLAHARIQQQLQASRSNPALLSMEDNEDIEWMTQLQEIADKFFAVDPAVEHATRQFLADPDENESFMHESLWVGPISALLMLGHL